jgi:hypothetical protein
MFNLEESCRILEKYFQQNAITFTKKEKDEYTKVYVYSKVYNITITMSSQMVDIRIPIQTEVFELEKLPKVAEYLKLINNIIGKSLYIDDKIIIYNKSQVSMESEDILDAVEDGVKYMIETVRVITNAINQIITENLTVKQAVDQTVILLKEIMPSERKNPMSTFIIKF